MLTSTRLNCGHRIPCTRHDEPGDQNLRLREVLAFAAGKGGPYIPAGSIVSMHDHKGELIVVWTDRAAMACGASFINLAWVHYGVECKVEHVLLDDVAALLNAKMNGEHRG